MMANQFCSIIQYQRNVLQSVVVDMYMLKIILLVIKNVCSSNALQHLRGACPLVLCMRLYSHAPVVCRTVNFRMVVLFIGKH